MGIYADFMGVITLGVERGGEPIQGSMTNIEDHKGG
jgi:hypothetical protein